MTGLEVIGALASIAQVGQYTISIIASLVRLYGTLEAAPGKFRSGCQQLDQLCETVVLIQHNTALQTKNVLAHADALAEQIIILDKMLKDMLLQTKQSRFKRVARAYMGYQSEARVTEVFAQVEMKKSALVLSVLEVNTHMTSAILNKVDALQTMSLNTSTPSSPTESNMSGSTLREYEPSEKSFIQEELNYHIYKGVVSTENAFQINGDVGQPKKLWFKNRYTDVTASGKSTQLNGNISAVELDAFITRTGNKR